MFGLVLGDGTGVAIDSKLKDRVVKISDKIRALLDMIGQLLN